MSHESNTRRSGSVATYTHSRYKCSENNICHPGCGAIGFFSRERRTKKSKQIRDMADKVSELTLGLISCTNRDPKYLISSSSNPFQIPYVSTKRNRVQYYPEDYDDIGFEVDEGTRLQAAYDLERV